jgi:hypothetical protein
VALKGVQGSTAMLVQHIAHPLTRPCCQAAAAAAAIRALQHKAMAPVTLACCAADAGAWGNGPFHCCWGRQLKPMLAALLGLPACLQVLHRLV